MTCVQVTGGKLALSSCTFPRRSFQGNGASACTSVFFGRELPKISLKLSLTKSVYRQRGPVCLFGGKGKPDNGNEASPWKAIEKVTGIFRKNTSIEDVLKQQIEKKEFYDEGGSGGEGPPGGGGGGGGDAFGGFGGASDDSPLAMLEEFGQQMMAMLALILLYAYIINGETMKAIVKDIFKFLLKGEKSFRLRRLINRWNDFLESMKEEEVYEDPFWLQHAIINTPTMYDGPDKYRELIKMRNIKISDDDSSGPEYDGSSPPKYGNSNDLEDDDDDDDDEGPPQYVESGPPDDYGDDDDQYSW